MRDTADRGGRVIIPAFAIGRVEELYPAPIEELKAELRRFPHLRAVRWVQDEPGNMGPAPHYELNVWPHVGVTVETARSRTSAFPP